MRLSRIKLAGFKSFVDPTSIQMPSDLVGVVGPNGCGKSNVIDAVRWVMGESSAKHLRGDSMDDVIFNGSSQRKPVGLASVELVFDNSDGTLSGQFSSFNEISVRRVVTREGQSQYYLNGTRCRRRDITDIFLGTGLGPRSYAIIEQGMISRLVEARPEDLRVFLEEAAGISKYKERRRETENRIRHTRENLDRLNDLREEVDKHLEHLQRQARTAERYKQLKQEESERKAELLVLRWNALSAELELRNQALQAQQTELEKTIAEQRALEASLETDRERHIEANDAFNQVQGRFYRLGADISREEQNIQHSRESVQRHQHELKRVEEAWSEARQHITQDREKLDALEQSMASDEPAYERLSESQRLSADLLAQAEETMQELQSEWETFNHQANQPAQAAQVERARMDQLERGIVRAEQRLQRIDDEQSRVDVEGLRDELETLAEEEAHAVGAETAADEHLQGLLAHVAEARNRVKQSEQELPRLREALQSNRGRQASLEALQQAAQERAEGGAGDWLQQRGLHEAPRLVQQLEVEAGWELAVETVLGPYLEAPLVDDLHTHALSLDGFDRGSLSLVVGGSAAGVELGAGLLGRLRNPPPALPAVLASVHAAEDLDAALDLRAGLGTHESVITRDGIWLGSDWLRVSREQQADGQGVLQREQALKRLRVEIDDQLEAIAIAEAARDDALSAQEQCEQQREEAQQALNQAHRNRSQIGSRLQGARQRQEQLQQRQAQLEAERQELRQQIERESDELKQAQQRRNAALADMERLAAERESLQSRREEVRAGLESARRHSQSQRDAHHEVAMRIESMRSSREATRQNLQRMESQLTHFEQRRGELRAALDGAADPIKAMEAELAELLERRVELEKEMAAARRLVEQIEADMRSREQQRMRRERQAEGLRSELERLRLDAQTVQVRRQTLDEQLAETSFERATIQEQLGAEANVADWETQLEAIAQRIQRLGSINLAAIDEYREESQRKAYLDQQNEDITQALSTLEQAIEKIDRETKTRFKATFDRVNNRLQELFPRLFGGGQAHLAMTDNDLLNTGVSIMARPPGKRVSNIHLLSGGEKALTAVALVFAFFELNPAPFCMLDEVDAPLDDANVGRFCAMVREMSSQVQFIFITHNKETMELANHLIGVTMNEPGVSRLVAVDVQEAARMAGAEG